MHTYNCNRCGKQFGSQSAVRMHLRNKHFHKEICHHCGLEIYQKRMKEHLTEAHPHDVGLPSIYKIPLSKSLQVMKPVDSAEEESFWEVPDVRLIRFTVPGTSMKCRLCGKTLGGVHGREQHERDAHHFTTQVKSSLALRFTSWNMLDFLKPADVREYINQDLKPKLSGTPECNNDVNLLVDFLIEQLNLDVTQIVRGGSYGKGTCLKGHSDLDMVMFVEGLPFFGGTSASANRLSNCIHEIKTRLQQSLLATRILISQVTSHALRFQYKCFKNDHIHHVDLMPCNDLLGSQPSNEDKMAIYDLIANCKNQNELQLLNSTIMQLQVEFVRHRPAIVHDLIRLVKHWRRTSFGQVTSLNRYKRLPNSYTLELITIHAWEVNGKPITFQMRRGLASVLRLLVNYESLSLVWCDNYSKKCKWLKETLQGSRRVLPIRCCTFIPESLSIL